MKNEINNQSVLLGIGTMFAISSAVFAIQTVVTPVEVSGEVSSSLTVDESDYSMDNVACADTFAMNEQDQLAMEYNKATVADCMYVGCGGIF